VLEKVPDSFMKKLQTKSQLSSSGRGNYTAPTFPLRKMVGDHLLPVKWDLLETRMTEVCPFLPCFAKCTPVINWMLGAGKE
jgi:hypothetical protein